MKYMKISNHKNLKNKVSKVLKTKGPIICELIMNPNEDKYRKQ